MAKTASRVEAGVVLVLPTAAAGILWTIWDSEWTKPNASSDFWSYNVSKAAVAVSAIAVLIWLAAVVGQIRARKRERRVDDEGDRRGIGIDRMSEAIEVLTATMKELIVQQGMGPPQSVGSSLTVPPGAEVFSAIGAGDLMGTSPEGEAVVLREGTGRVFPNGATLRSASDEVRIVDSARGPGHLLRSAHDEVRTDDSAS